MNPAVTIIAYSYKAIGFQFGYSMPGYYEDQLDGVTYQNFFEAVNLES